MQFVDDGAASESEGEGEGEDEDDGDGLRELLAAGEWCQCAIFATI
jgi:hypothetical protein